MSTHIAKRALLQRQFEERCRLLKKIRALPPVRKARYQIGGPKMVWMDVRQLNVWLDDMERLTHLEARRRHVEDPLSFPTTMGNPFEEKE